MITSIIYHGLVVVFSTVREEDEMRGLKAETEDIKI